MKKILSLLLAVLMIVPIFSQISVSAANNNITLEQVKKYYPNMGYVDTYYYGGKEAYGDSTKAYKCYYLENKNTTVDICFFKDNVLETNKSIVEKLALVYYANTFSDVQTFEPFSSGLAETAVDYSNLNLAVEVSKYLVTTGTNYLLTQNIGTSLKNASKSFLTGLAEDVSSTVLNGCILFMHGIADEGLDAYEYVKSNRNTSYAKTTTGAKQIADNIDIMFRNGRVLIQLAQYLIVENSNMDALEYLKSVGQSVMNSVFGNAPDKNDKLVKFAVEVLEGTDFIEACGSYISVLGTFPEIKRAYETYTAEIYSDCVKDLVVTTQNTICERVGIVSAPPSTSSYTTGTYKPSEWDGLNMRSGAATSYSKVGAIAAGTNFVVTQVNGIWGKTTCNGVTGWVCLDYATKVSSSTTTTPAKKSYEIDVNGHINGNYKTSLDGYVTFDVYINGSCVKNDVGDFCTSYVDGTSYEIKDIKAKNGYKYVSGSSLSGKINGEKVWVYLTLESSGTEAEDSTGFVEYVNSRVGESFGKGRCQAFVWQVVYNHFGKDADACCATNAWSKWKQSSSRNDIPLGAAVYFGNSGTTDSVCGKDAGHSAIYVGNNTIVHAWDGKIVSTTIDWVTNRGYSYRGWGWQANLKITQSTTDKEPEQEKTPETNTPEYETINEGTYVLNCIIQSYRYLTAKTDSNGGQVEAKPFENIDAQKFDIVKSGNGYKIVSKNSSTGRVVSGYNDGFGQTIGNVTLANSSSSSSQVWLFRKEGDCYVIYPSFNTSLALTSASTGRVVVSTYTGNDDQLWKLSLQNEEPEEYTVTYNANGGSGTPKEQTKTAGEDLKLSSTEPTRNGYKFLGWATSKTGNVKFESGDKYTDDKNITLYAVWEEIKTYTIKYNANGGAGSPSSQTKTHGESIKVSSQKPTRSGYEFDGWATSANGNVEYDPSENYTKDSDITLYAVWMPLTYKVTYNANGGTGAPASQTKIHNEKLYITGDTPERDGYSFVGWATTKTGSVSYKAGQQYTSDKDITLYAVWEANTYNISYNANGGSSAPKNQTKKYAESIKLSTQEPTRKDYIFLGWSTSAQGSVEFAPGSVCSVNENITLYALWQEEENEVYYIIYNANGGKNAPSMQTKNEDEDITISEVVPTREGYTFDGWAIGNDDTVVYSSGDTYQENKTLYLHAVWTANTYTISYNANGGVGAPRNQTKIHDEDIVLSTVEPEKEGHMFIGWSDDRYAEYAKYYAEDTFSKNSDTVLYAVWEEIIEEDEEDEETNDDKNQSQKEIPFEDVPEDAWYRKDVENAYKNGLINGKSEKRYAPNDNMTYAEAIKLACTIYQLYYDGEVTLTNGSDVWYSTYMDYALENRIVRTDYSSVANEYVTRKEFVNIFYGALPLKEFAKINNVEDNIIPDVKIGDAYSGEIYTFYRAGILTGNDAKGTFKPDSNISRSEVAAIVTRMLDNGARKEIYIK